MEKHCVTVNDFVRRQTTESGKTYSCDLSFEEIVDYVELRFNNGFFRKGYRDGVVIVEGTYAIAKHFICPYVKIDKNTILKAEWVKRRKGEEPYIQIRARNPEVSGLKAKKIEFILYRHDVLKDNNENTTDAEWELVSIHAIPEGVDKLPIGPVTMMRNQLQLPGGTAAHYSSDDWAESVRFWQQYASLEP